jgi:hypothetical protein
MRFTIRSAAAGALGLFSIAGVASAQSFSDGSFTTGWTTTTIVSSGGSASSAPLAINGNPGAYLSTNDFVFAGYTAGAHVSPFSWDPSTQGAITGLSVSYDYTATNNAMGFGTLVRQGGLYYWSGALGDYNAPAGGSGWWSFSNANEPLAASSWCQVYGSFYTTFTCGAGQVDFSATGSQIDFGVYTANSGYIYGADGGIDNFDVDLTIASSAVAAPEPGSLVLLATGFAGIAAWRRRRIAA